MYYYMIFINKLDLISFWLVYRVKKYLMLLVEFRFLEFNNYEGLIVLKIGMGYSLSVKLYG